jgi:uncharacterized RDD family membrane protein YckC
MRMASSWYYVDANGQQVGPVSADEIRAALQSGAATNASLAWRDGLANWQPISALAAELGIAAAAASTVAAPAAELPSAWKQSAEANPYRAPEAESSEGFFENTTDIVYAGFWKRWAALFLDQLIIGLPLSIAFFFISFTVAMSSGGQPSATTTIFLQLGFYAVWLSVAFFYYASLESSEAQATFGKRALGIKVTDMSGQRIDFKQAAFRWFAASLSYMAMYIGFAMAGFTQRKQALHDLLVSTLVVDRWAFTRFPERQQRGLGGCAIVFIVVIAGSLLLIPIFIAVAISQYQDYARRAGSAYVEPEARMVCEAPVSSTYVARCLPPSFEA